jgi:hypothetical protein
MPWRLGTTRIVTPAMVSSSPPLTTRRWASGTPLARARFAVLSVPTIVAPVFVAM